MAKTDEERKAEKTQRLLEKSMRMPINDVVLEVQKGTIDLKDVFTRIETKVKEGLKNG
jgi:hypothetical protein